MSLSPNEKALVDKSLGKIEATLNSLLYISNDDIDKSEIIQHLSMSIADLELAQQPLITVRNKVRKRKEDNNG